MPGPKTIIAFHSGIVGALMSFPEFGFGVIIFIIVLWSMYICLCKKAGISLSQNFGCIFVLGVIVNIIVALLLNLFLPIISGPIVAVQFYLSGIIFWTMIQGLLDSGNK